MRLMLYIWLLIPILSVFGQNEQLARNYFDIGDFEKAKIIYEELLKSQPSNSIYFTKVVECYQEMEQFDASETLLKNQLNKGIQGNLLVELGYNYQLKKQSELAKKNYDDAIQRVNINPGEWYMVAQAFEKRSLYLYALNTYELIQKVQPQVAVNLNKASIYGQLGRYEEMIDVYLDESKLNQANAPFIQSRLGRYMMEDANDQFTGLLRKSLLVRAQKDQDVFWNSFLSWFFIQQKEYNKAFVQEKAVYKRNQESLNNIMILAQLSMDEKDIDTAKDIYTYILENSYDLSEKSKAKQSLLKFKVDAAQPKDFAAIDAEFNQVLDEYGRNPQTLQIQMLQAQFVTFNMQNPAKGKELLQEAMKLNLSRYQLAECKMKLADIYLFEEKFNQALLVYSQIEDDLKNDSMGHEANLRAARTSYFKGDFDWAMQQFGALKSANTQLIANDALDYYLLINDNKVADSTQLAMKEFAKADFLKFQNKNQLAKEKFLSILENFKGNEIEAVTHLRLGQLGEELGDFNFALKHYQIITEKFSDGIYIDEALYFSGCVYQEHLQDSEKAKAQFEKLIFEHQDSIYFVDGRRRYRALRGDTNL